MLDDTIEEELIVTKDGRVDKGREDVEVEKTMLQDVDELDEGTVIREEEDTTIGRTARDVGELDGRKDMLVVTDEVLAGAGMAVHV